MKRRLLITGSKGQVGSDLRNILVGPEDEVIATDYHELDLTDAQSIRTMLRDIRPHVVLNAGAHTAVDKAESEPDLARALNTHAPAVLAEECHALDALLVHYSTDYVFDGKSDRPWQPDDPTSPCNMYGQTKLEGEQAITNTCERHCILRTSWVYSDHGQNFLKTMLRLGAERDELSIVNDQFGAPNWSRNLARWTMEIVDQLAPATDPCAHGSRKYGTYHLSSSGEATWFDFAAAIFDAANLITKPILKAVPTSAFPTPAERPANSRLDCSTTVKTFGLNLTPWQIDVATVVQAVQAMKKDHPEASNAAG